MRMHDSLRHPRVFCLYSQWIISPESLFKKTNWGSRGNKRTVPVVVAVLGFEKQRPPSPTSSFDLNNSKFNSLSFPEWISAIMVQLYYYEQRGKSCKDLWEHTAKEGGGSLKVSRFSQWLFSGREEILLHISTAAVLCHSAHARTQLSQLSDPPSLKISCVHFTLSLSRRRPRPDFLSLLLICVSPFGRDPGHSVLLQPNFHLSTSTHTHMHAHPPYPPLPPQSFWHLSM